MKEKKCFKERIKQSFLGYFFAFIVMLSGVFGITSAVLTTDVYAEPETTEVTGDNNGDENKTDEKSEEEKKKEEEEQKKKEEEEQKKKEEEERKKKEEEEKKKKTGENKCQTELEAIGWLVCPTTGKISEAVDWLYGTIENLLVVNPVEAKDGTPIYEIWKYCRGVTNIIFIIFLLVVIYSQLTGLGINNYGLKKVLPKLIVAAVLVNLSFLVCQLGIDLSNIIGNGLRGVFTSVQDTVIANMEVTKEASESMHLAYAELYGALAGGSMIAVGAGMISFENGTIWMLIPIVLGAVVAVASGLITIALRQAVVALLVMVAPLAVVANILPNTEKWFKKWKDLLVQMLVFYPMFSLLFGASSLAGFAIIASAKDAFWLIVGVAVQVFPLFFSWSLMKMSGTVLGTINAKMRGIGDKTVASTKSWADSHRQATKAKHLASRQAYTPSLALMQYMSNRKVAREAEMAENQEAIKNRGLAYKVSKAYDKNGAASKKGAREYERQIDNIAYTNMVDRHKHNLDLGLGSIKVQPKDAKLAGRLKQLDAEIINVSDTAKMEKARGERIEYYNAEGYHKRMDDAINAHFDEQHKNKDGYKLHDLGSEANRAEALARYNLAYDVMEGDLHDTQYAAAYAAQAYDTQKKLGEAKMNKYFDLTPPTKDVEYRLNELTRRHYNRRTHELTYDPIKNIDSIVAGLRVLNQRGDTDMLKEQLENVLTKEIGGGVKLGTHASQALASFLMFEVKDSDPFLRRFGKHINLETAKVYNESKRKQEYVTYDEYMTGQYTEPDGTVKYAKKDAVKLLEGTSLDNIERTALSSFDESLKKAYGYDPENKEKPWNVKGYLNRRKALQTAFEPAFLSAGLKWMSGSEQISSAVKFWTGYETKPRSDGHGGFVTDKDGNLVYDLKPVWEEKEFDGHEEEVKAFYNDRTDAFIKDQTTGQILGMRTDFRDPVMKHMLENYLNDEKDGKAPAEKWREYRAKCNEINSRYAGEPPKIAMKKREDDLHALEMQLAGKHVRKILGNSGKLKQIHRTRPSGTAINAKDWLRKDWLLLDDEAALKREVDYYDRIRSQAQETELNENSGVGEGGVAIEEDGIIYSASDRDRFINEMRAFNSRVRDDAPEVFFEETRDQLVQWFSDNSLIVKKYEQYYQDDRPNADNDELLRAIISILSDKNNYPDA